MKKIFVFVFALLFALCLVACGNKEDNKKQEADPLVPTAIALKVKVAKVQINTKIKLTYSITPATAQGDDVTVSVNNDLATCAKTGTNGIELTAGAKTGTVKVTVTTSNGIQASKTIKIQEEAVESYPDLSGYEIKIANAEHALGEYDVRLTKETADKYGFYEGSDREFKIQAIEEIEDNYNCSIAFVAYPSDAPWGPSRWNYILTQAQNEAPEYDFYIIESAQIPNFVAGNAILDMTDWYAAYGKNTMTDMNVSSSTYKGRIYAFAPRDNTVLNIMGYNVGLWEKINKEYPDIKEPAQMYLDGEWTYSKFKEYCLKVQNAMNTMFTDETYYAVSGTGSYYWRGMVNAAGVNILDSIQLKCNITGVVETQAAQILQEIYAAGAMDSSFQVDSVSTWNAGHSFFNIADLWFVNSSNRWPKNLWTSEEETKYGYVPFPTSDTSDKTYIGITGDGFFVMSTGREWAYKGFGDECCAENIYRAFVDYYATGRDYYYASEDYSAVEAARLLASSKFDSEASVKAFVQVVCGKQDANGKYYDSIAELGFYDPFTGSNPVVSVDNGTGTFGGAINSFIKGTDSAQWIDAVGQFQAVIEKALVDAYG